MPLPTAAELTDPTATNTQMKQRLGQLAENVESKEASDSKIRVLSIYKNSKDHCEVVIDTNGFTRVKMLTNENTTEVYDVRIDENIKDIEALKAGSIGFEIYGSSIGIVSAYVDENGFTRIKEENLTGGVFNSYVGTKQKTLIAGTGISLLENPESIEISAGEISYETPTEYVLCLVIGQSNNTTEGGNEAEAPVLPRGAVNANTFSLMEI